MFKKSLIVMLVFFVLFVITSCSGGLNPMTPKEGLADLVLTDEIIPVGVTDYDSSGNVSQGYGALGLFTVNIDPVSLTGEMSPLRQSSSTDTLEVVDITNFLKIAPCVDCAKLMGIELNSDNNVVLKIGIKHPFPAGDPFKPISGKNRADLHVFNVEGLVVTDKTGLVDFPQLGVKADTAGLINADGYSGYLDSALDEIFLTEANLHPYIMHFDDYSAGNYSPINPSGFESLTNPPPSGNLVMPMGSDYDVKDYIFDIQGSFNFIYAIGCTYAISAENKAQRFTPVYRVPQHNKKAASQVWVDITRNDLEEGDTASSADISVSVVDINHGVIVGTALNEMKADSSVSDVSVEIPGITQGSISFGNSPVSGSGHDPSDPLIFTGTITNQADALRGLYTGLVKVLDAYPVGQNQSPLLNGKNGIKRVGPIENPLAGIFAISEFATYMPFTIEVLSGGALTAVITSSPSPPNAFTCQFITFDGSLSNDTLGYNIVEYQWDWDYTGVPAEFVADKMTTTPTAKHQYPTEGLHRTALRVVNDAPSPMTSEPAFLEHTLIRPLPSEYVYQESHKISDGSGSKDIWMPSSNAIVVDSNDVVHAFGKVGSTLFHYSYDNGTISSETIGPLTGYSHQSAQIDSNDVIHLVWMDSGSLNYIENSTGTWSAPLAIASGADFEGDPYSYSMGINGQNELMVVTQELFTTNHNMNYIYKTSSGWTTMQLLQHTDSSTGSPYSELAIMVSCAGTPGENGGDFHAMWTEQYTAGYMNPAVRYAKFDRVTETWSAPEWVMEPLTHYQDWSDMTVTSDGSVFIGSSIFWQTSYVAYKNPGTGTWQNWVIANTSHDEYTSTIGANDDGTICIAYWERVGYPDPDPFEVQFKVFHKSMSQAEVDAITPLPADPSTTYEYMYGDIFMKECSYYVLYQDARDSLGAGDRELYFSRISNE